MTEPTPTFGTESSTSATGATPGDSPKAHFAKAVEEALAGAHAMRGQAHERAETYREKVHQAKSEWTDDARARSDQARERALTLATEGKARASGAIANLAKTVGDSAGLIDERFGVKYGDYVRGAQRSLEDAAERIDATDIAKFSEDTRAFVRSSPGLAVGIAAIGGFMMARLFKAPER
jgi:ElaB/YqjD/DUF883 family membrane-anchored ribosome-binding protein